MIKIAVIAALAFAFMPLGGCESNPQKTAQSVEQQGDALYGEYVIAKEQAAKVITDPSVSDEIKRPIAEAAVASKAGGDGLYAALFVYANARQQMANGTTTQEKLTIAATQLGQWIITAAPLIKTLSDAVAKGK